MHCQQILYKNCMYMLCGVVSHDQVCSQVERSGSVVENDKCVQCRTYNQKCSKSLRAIYKLSEFQVVIMGAQCTYIHT